MTWAVDHPQRRGWRRQARHAETGAAADIRAVVAPLGASLAGTLAVLVGAWGAISVFVGPYFGYHPTTDSTWSWTTQNWLLHLIPGAVGFVGGLLAVEETRRRKVGAGGTLGIPALSIMAAGIWFVIGPAVWPIFESGPAFSATSSPGGAALNVIGSSFGPGLLLAILGGMAWKAGIARPRAGIAPPAAVDALPADRPVAGGPGAAPAPLTDTRGPGGTPSPTGGQAGERGVAGPPPDEIRDEPL